MNLSEHIKIEFPNKKVVILGDLVADQFLEGTINRISREAPVFILRHETTKTLPGGAANAAANVASLGAKAIAVGLVGKDTNGNALLESLKAANVNCEHVIASENFQTTTKVRVLAGQQYAPRQQVIRIDYENKAELDTSVKVALKNNLIEATKDADAIIISDYNYGVVSAELAELANSIAKEKDIPLLIDSRFRLENFKGATSATPNKEEVEHILGSELTDSGCAQLLEELGYQSLLVTLGNKGMLLLETGKSPLHIDCIGSKEPVDVTGAGDTVIAAYALGLASGLGFADSARIANHAGGIVVMKKGTATVSTEELLASLEKDEHLRQKAQTL